VYPCIRFVMKVIFKSLVQERKFGSGKLDISSVDNLRVKLQFCFLCVLTSIYAVLDGLIIYNIV
jgi:hypothetical protein